MKAGGKGSQLNGSECRSVAKSCWTFNKSLNLSEPSCIYSKDMAVILHGTVVSF